MAKVELIFTAEEREQGITNPNRYMFKCPGCGGWHVLPTRPEPIDGYWGFNGNVEKPTFKPSILVTSGHYVDGQPQPPNCEHCNAGHTCCYKCHSYVTDGKIQFLNDCTHELAGQTVELSNIE